NIMDEVDIKDLTIEQYLRLTQENQTPKKIEDMTIAEYEFAHYFGPNQPGAKYDCGLEDMEEEVEYMTNDEVVMREQEESNHGYPQNFQHFEENDDVNKWLNAEITKHMSMQGVENTEDALISIIKSIKKEMKDDIMKKQIEASTANIGNETSSITSNEVDTDDDNTSTIASCLLPKELSPRSFLLPFKINNHSLYAITTLDAKDNIIPLNVYEYLGLDEFRGASTLENTTETNEPLGTIDILLPIRPRPCNYSFEEWLKIRIGHNNLHESDSEFIFNEWILDSYDVEEEYAREIGDPYSRKFYEYNRDDVWEKCQQNYKITNEAWHEVAYEEDKMWRIGDEKTDYDLPYVNIETFEVKKYSFKGGRSFICITDREDEALPLGRVNGARFEAMIRKELEGHKIQKLRGNSQDRLDSYSFGNLAEFAAVMP
ncbi:hypothetical protein Tco_1077670, partial [Tanacetum coccineum]